MIDVIKVNLKNYPQITLNIINANDRKIIEEFGMSRGIFINGKPAIKRIASWKEIKTAIEKIQKELD